jgi:hypothetical protein
MIKINKIFKKRLTNKLNIKNRYILKNFRVIQPKKFRYFQYHKIIYNLDNNNYCLYSYDKDRRYDIDKAIWYKNGLRHRDGKTLPALLTVNNVKYYYKEGQSMSLLGNRLWKLKYDKNK